MTKILVFALIGVAMIADGISAAPADEKAWLACKKDSECASVQLGCWYWQPVNRRHADDMTAKYGPDCSRSVPAGPEPTLVCANHACSNQYTVKYWKQLDQVPFKNQWIGNKIDACLKAAKVSIDWDGVSKTTHVSKMYDYIELREPFIKKMDDAVGAGTLKDSEPLQRAIDATISCKEVMRRAASYKD